MPEEKGATWVSLIKGRDLESASLRLSSYPWQVHWWDFTHAHDWIGRRPAKPGRNTKTIRPKPPLRFTCDFHTREEAEDFAANLRQSDEIVARVVSMRDLLPPKPENVAFPDAGFWPRQERRMT